MDIPVIDLFAGPGGLGEGFSKSLGARFGLAVSIEKDPSAWQTLRLRAVHRHLLKAEADPDLWAWWDRQVLESPWPVLFDRLMTSGIRLVGEACDRAELECQRLELGPTSRTTVNKVIRRRLAEFTGRETMPDNVVLIGGPPCQAYSHVGRARNRGVKDYRAEEDSRHFLYLEYLHVISEFRPAVFIMENVKGILTSKINDDWFIFHSIIEDLRRPGLSINGEDSLEYVLVALASGRDSDRDELSPSDFVVRAEDYGIPQARHRVIICGIRRDVYSRLEARPALKSELRPRTALEAFIRDLPRLRPRVSYRGQGTGWPDALLANPLVQTAIDELQARGDGVGRAIAARMLQALSDIRATVDPGSGSERSVLAPGHDGPLSDWYRDRPTGVLANHEAKAHMPSDLVRYLFASCHGDVTGRSPKLQDFPPSLLPLHRNVDPRNPASSVFKDRFRVQLGGAPATTITCHLAKDGHAFIHPDPTQTRSLTVREAARLQTFPDTYVFLGSRTSQYTQVGNAVPPLLARKIADAIGAALAQAFGNEGTARTEPAISHKDEEAALPASATH